MLEALASGISKAARHAHHLRHRRRLLLAVKEAAKRRKISVGALMSEPARKGLNAGAMPTAKQPAKSAAALQALGIATLPRRGGLVTNDLINRVRDDGPV